MWNRPKKGHENDSGLCITFEVPDFIQFTSVQNATVHNWTMPLFGTSMSSSLLVGWAPGPKPSLFGKRTNWEVGLSTGLA